MTVRFLPSGDTALVVEFGDRIDHALNARVLRLNAAVRAARLTGVVETMPTFRSLMVHYDPRQTAGEALVKSIERLLDEGAERLRETRRWHIPACYDAEHGPDLAAVAERAGLSTDDVVRLHSSTEYLVYMVGFSPGFPYMGDVPAPLALPRRTDPRVRVPGGSIAIAAGMTAVYPMESPGGWHLLGATPARLFDLTWEQPALLASGDNVRFEPIDRKNYDEIRAAVAAGTYRVPCEKISA